ncbi:DUF5677 domain-containing protein [Pectobacterium polaris]|uniref:DUF5677 domain-containing protein n=1 Tax=Pectobacterium polaris TaxID=2042057 RepID=UPI001581756A|nr:DUF5677 domain-containing protein [Pectobacterium polaris]MDE8743018.1 DUF5677 domain-containing protein [Pectobacterium polaris]
MYTDELFAIQSDWSKNSLLLMRELLPLMAPVALFEQWTKEEQSTIGCLLAASARSTESLFLLTSYGQLWDAEMMQRAIIEASLKFVFLLESREKFKERFNEYSTAQYEISLLKDDNKVLELLSILPNPDDEQWLPLRERLLADEERKRINETYEKSYRRSLETRWGFTSIIGSLTRSGKPFHGFSGLSYGYSVSSHVLHADYLGVVLPIERDSRGHEHLSAVHLAHLSRHISDAFTCLIMRLYVGYRFVGIDTAVINEAIKKIDDLQVPFREEYNKWIDIEYGGK